MKKKIRRPCQICYQKTATHYIVVYEEGRKAYLTCEACRALHCKQW